VEITLKTFLIVCPLVFLGGFVDSIAGGGGLITLPAYLLAGLPMHTALGTNKFTSSLGTTVSTARYWKNNYVDKKLAIPTIAAALVGSAIGAKLTLLVPEKTLQYVLLIVLPVVSFFVLKKKNFGEEPAACSQSRKKTVVIATVASFVIGAYDGFYGPGTGTFIILVFTGFAKMNVKTASGNAKLMNLASNVAAVVTFIISGKVNFIIGGAAAIFSILGHYIGSGMLIKNSGKIVKPVILGVLVLLFLKVAFWS